MPSGVLALAALLLLLVLLAILVAGGFDPRGPEPRSTPPPYARVLGSLDQYWTTSLRPPPLAERAVVYCSGPLFNLSEVIYALGWRGLLPPSTSLETLYGLDAAQLTAIGKQAEALGLHPYGLCGELAQQGLEAYCPARDGFTLAVILAAINGPDGPGPPEAAELSDYMSKAIYAIDAFCLGAICNCGILNANGLQIDDGSATEVGMMGMRGMPLVIYRDQATSQLGPGVQNPMPIGNASSTLSPTGHSTVRSAVLALKQKIAAVLAGAPAWIGSPSYAHDVPPPPLYIYWQTIGRAVYDVKFKTKSRVVDGNGRLDTKASYTSFFYNSYVAQPTPENLVAIARRVTAAIKQVEALFQPLIDLYPEAALPKAGGAGYGR